MIKYNTKKANNCKAHQQCVESLKSLKVKRSTENQLLENEFSIKRKKKFENENKKMYTAKGR